MENNNTEQAFNHLYGAIALTSSYVAAIIYQTQLLPPQDISSKRFTATWNIKSMVGHWGKRFMSLWDEVERMKTLYDTTPQTDAVPNVGDPNDQMSPEARAWLDELSQIDTDSHLGGSPRKEYTQEEILANVQRLRQELVFAIKNLTYAHYDGVWKGMEKKVFDLYDTVPTVFIDRFLTAYGVTIGGAEE